MNALHYVAPIFLIALLVEGIAFRAYTLRRLLSALGCVALDRLFYASAFSVFQIAFDALHTRVALVTLDSASLSTWLFAIVGHDIAYYAFHRASHRVHVLWAAHVVHHHGESYDFTTSLRQGTVATWITLLFYLPLAFFVDARVFAGVHAAYQVYQFFVHTRAVRTLGPLEWILATPSHHRVHHGRDRRSLDRNYGGFFIVFDRLLGTFTREREDREPAYGVPGGYDVVSPLFANTYVFARLVAASREARGARALVRLWLGPPEASARLLGSAAHAPAPNDGASIVRACAPFVLGLLGTAIIVLFRERLPGAAVALGTVAVIFVIEIGSAMLDGRSSTPKPRPHTVG